MNIVELTADGRLLTYASEFDIRDGLAEWAEMDGWDVDTEHVVPGWGRPDLYLGAGETRVGVEIKVELTTPSKCRKAVQQADNYLRALPEIDVVYLVAAHINREVMEPYSAAYPNVRIQTVERFFRTLGGLRDGIQWRHRTALRRFRAAEVELEKRRRALASLAEFEGSYLRPGLAAPTPDRHLAPGLGLIFDEVE